MILSEKQRISCIFEVLIFFSGIFFSYMYTGTCWLYLGIVPKHVSHSKIVMKRKKMTEKLRRLAVTYSKKIAQL